MHLDCYRHICLNFLFSTFFILTIFQVTNLLCNDFYSLIPLVGSMSIFLCMSMTWRKIVPCLQMCKFHHSCLVKVQERSHRYQPSISMRVFYRNLGMLLDRIGSYHYLYISLCCWYDLLFSFFLSFLSVKY